MRRWRSKLFLPESVIRAADKDMRRTGGVDGGSTLWPQCQVCSLRTGTRFAVEAYGVADKGLTAGGEPYTDVRARCHGAEDVVRIEGMNWNMKRDGDTADIVRIAAIGAILFFSEESKTIPARLFRAFIGAH